MRGDTCWEMAWTRQGTRDDMNEKQHKRRKMEHGHEAAKKVSMNVGYPRVQYH